jgi:hypothetical protein
MSECARRHLLCITGLTPQVVTETLYALYREEPAQLPTDIHVLSTDDGIARARLTLLSDQPGWFHRLCADYRLPPMRFGPDSLHVLHNGDGQPLSDIRDGADNASAADMVTEWVRRLTVDDADQVHVSLGVCRTFSIPDAADAIKYRASRAATESSLWVASFLFRESNATFCLPRCMNGFRKTTWPVLSSRWWINWILLR